MKYFKPIMVVLLLLIVLQASGAIITNGGKGLPYTRAAWTVDAGRLTALAHTRFWGKVAQVPDFRFNIETGATIWDVQSLLSLNYGISRHFELNITPVLYQDDQSKKGVYPWDTFISLKIGSFGSKASSLQYGIQLNSRFPTGQSRNIIFEEYHAGRPEFGFTGLLSYALDPLYPEDSFNMHFNLGYNNYNDVGVILTKDAKDPFSRVLHQTQEALYSAGMVIPTERFDYGLEWFGNAWLQRPPVTAAGRENYLFMNGSVRYKPYRWFNFFVAAALRLSENTDTTVGPYAAPGKLPNYNSWRVQVGAQFTLLPTSVYRTNERDILMQKAESRRELFEQIIRERKETESAEEELERIREERRKAERELERLRKILESQGTQQKQDLHNDTPQNP